MTEITLDELGLSVVLDTDFESALESVAAALKAEGFGILTEIDVKTTMKQKLAVDFQPYKILGACNPPLAHQALTTSPEIGLLLPCNVIVYQLENGKTQVSLVDPMVMLQVADKPELQAIAEEARARLDRVKATLEA